MCGFTAIADTSLTPSEAYSLSERMLAVMAHRGPDARRVEQDGAVSLGHNRLSIIDLSDASHQPLTRSGCTIAFNGEVYNYVELRSELQRDGVVFTTTGDTEVVLQAYLHWQDACLERFIGMWAFAIWDSRKQRLFCARDRFGIKPFHYALSGGRLHIASEIKALRLSPLVSKTLNTDQVARGLYLGWMHHWDETYFTDIKALPAAHALVWQNGSASVTQYAHLNTQQNTTMSFDDSVAQFRELFIDSIRLTSRRDVPMGVCLSGGLDSTSIACCLASQTNEHNVETFTAYYTGAGDVDERPYINHVLAAYPGIKPHYISPTDTDVAEALPVIAAMMDAPLPSSSYISQYFVMKLAAENGIKVVLDGQGSDEIMGGYMHSMYRVIADLIRDVQPADAIREWNAHRKRQLYNPLKSASVLAKSVLTLVREEQQLYELEFRRTYPWILQSSNTAIRLNIPDPAGSHLNGFLHNLVFVTLLPTLLHTEDINSMAFSIESRVPFLDHRLVELCFSMPNNHKIHLGETKRVLRAAMRGIVPDAVLDRKDKTGFVTPGHTTWLRGALRSYLHSDWSVLSDLLDVDKLRHVIKEYENGNNSNALFIWRFIMLKVFAETALR